MLYQPTQDLKPLISIVRPKEEAPKEQLYIIKEGDTLTSISEAQGTTVERLWAKNTELTDPNLIEPNKPLKIPQNEEVLPAREMSSTIQSSEITAKISPPSGGFSSSGYGWGWCVWYAAQQRPDLHIMDNASGWIRFANSSEPRVGAVAVNTFAAGGFGHVGIVRDFNATQVLVESMNYQAFGKVTVDWIDRGYWQGYIL